MESWERYVCPLLPGGLKEKLQEWGLTGVEEIRIRAGRPVYVLGEREGILDWYPTMGDCRELMLRLCGQSLYAYDAELQACYLTLPGGFRVGLAGRMAQTEKGYRLQSPAGFNIRLARPFPGCADGLLPLLLEEHGVKSTLLVSAPGVGKTTLLRDAARSLSLMGIKVCIADERRELAGCDNGMPTLDIGPCTDVLDGCPKAVALRLLLRGMSPELLVTDEIATKGDAEAIRDASGCGVPLLASAHGAALWDLQRRKHIYSLVKDGCFQQVIALRRRPGEPLALYRLYPEGKTWA